VLEGETVTIVIGVVVDPSNVMLTEVVWTIEVVLVWTRGIEVVVAPPPLPPPVPPPEPPPPPL